MSEIKNLIKNDPVHERKLEIRTYPLVDDRMIVEGWLKDTQLVSIYLLAGEHRPPCVVHHICVRLLVEGWPLSILDAEAEMISVPHDLCLTTLDTVKKLTGLRIVSGYSERVHNLLGGIQSCAHIAHLVTVMGPAALHGYWMHQWRNQRPIPASLEQVKDLGGVINTCRLWREDGPLVQNIKEAIQKKKGKTTQVH